MTPNLIQQFKAARRVSTPLVACKTPDPAATMQGLMSAFNGSCPPVVSWECVKGLRGVNAEGESALAQIGDEAREMSVNPVEALSALLKLPTRTITFFQGAGRQFENAGVVQAIWNLRDPFKRDRRTLVLLGPDFSIPGELTHDVLTLDEPLPDAGALETITRSIYEAANMEADEETLEKATDAVSGLAAFAAEQVVAMSLTESGLDLGALWERKRQTIEATPGLSVWRGNETFSDIGGLHNIKTFLSRVVSGNEPPRAVVFIDEIEKALSGAGAGGDTSGVAQDQLGTILSWMQDNRATGIICVGPPGTSKSLIAKAMGNEAGVPTVALDLGAMKGSLVGQSEQQLRGALKVVKAMAGERVFFIATCNSLSALPPELRRRFTFGTFFFDLPTGEERAKIWEIFAAKYGLALDVQNLGFPDAKWTGAEIKQACEIAYRLNCALSEAAKYIVPVAISAADQVERLRQGASGRFLSASHEGIFRADAKPELHNSNSSGRAISFEGGEF